MHVHGRELWSGSRMCLGIFWKQDNLGKYLRMGNSLVHLCAMGGIVDDARLVFDLIMTV